jgi:hypothetical protein
MIGSEGEAAAVDSQRDVDIYLKAADEQNLKITYSKLICTPPNFQKLRSNSPRHDASCHWRCDWRIVVLVGPQRLEPNLFLAA